MICAIVLAAGRSRRMGTQKLLLPIGGKPMIARIVDELLASSVGKVFVVTGVDGDRIQQALAGRPVSWIANPDLASDMLDSIRCGLRAAPDDCRAMLIVLGDQPNLSAALVNDLIGAFTRGPAEVVVPVFDGHRGHPVLIAARHRNELLTRRDREGLLGFLNSHLDKTSCVAVAAAAALADLDTPEEYRRQQESLPA